jgi:molybdenum cofactor biosynthesis enzyme
MDRLKLNFNLDNLSLPDSFPRVPYLPENHQPIAYAAAAGLLGTIALKSLYTYTTKKKLKLYYFDIAGKGECIRLACAYGGIHLEDVRIPIDNRETFEQLKKEGKLPFGQLPAVELPDGTILAQTAAIMRYVGKISGLYPVCPVAAAKVDAAIDAESDLFAGLGISIYRGKH